jgi:hypothetical protein
MNVKQKEIDILKEVVSDYEKEAYGALIKILEEQFKPVGPIEEMFVDRIGLCMLRLYRSGKAENEFMRSVLNPHFDIIVGDGYVPKVGAKAIENLTDTFLRYEIILENRMYKSIYELQRIQSIRTGNPVPPKPPILQIEIEKQE